MGRTMEPVAESGSWPTWMALVAKPMGTISLLSQVCKYKPRNPIWACRMRKPHSSFKLQEAACVVNSRKLRVKCSVSDYRRVYQGLVLAAHREQQFQHDDLRCK